MSTLSQQLTKYLMEAETWVQKGLILGLIWKDSRKFTKYLPDTVSRELRKLESESVIAVKKDPKSKSVVYKWIPFEMRNRYIHPVDRKDDKLFKK